MECRTNSRARSSSLEVGSKPLGLMTSRMLLTSHTLVGVTSAASEMVTSPGRMVSSERTRARSPSCILISSHRASYHCSNESMS